MHELHLMDQIVKLVEGQLEAHPGARPTVVRLKVSALSHLHGHELPYLRSAFALAARDTPAEDASLEVISVPVPAACRSCGAQGEVNGEVMTCRTCGSGDLAIEAVPEVVLHEMVVEE